jgi:hypothetical protein
MTQVLAAINHRLSEEFGKIELGTTDAKDRCVIGDGSAWAVEEHLSSVV